MQQKNGYIENTKITCNFPEEYKNCLRMSLNNCQVFLNNVTLCILLNELATKTLENLTFFIIFSNNAVDFLLVLPHV